MAERPKGSGAPEEGTPEYEWLYGRHGQSAGDDATRVVPTGAQGGHDRPDETRVMPAADRAARGGGSRPASPPPPRPTPSAAGRRPRGRRLRGCGCSSLLVLVVVLLLVYLLGVPLYAWTKVDKVAAMPDGDRPEDQPGTTYLLVGSDSRDDLTEQERRELGTGGPVGQRTDTIMLLHTGDGPDLLMSIPRDSIVEIPGHGTNKVNAAFAFGGPELLVRTLENETGIRIDDYVEIGFGGFVGMVDAVGGVEICPTQDMNDPLANLDIEKGCQDVDGKTALGYARSRHTSGLGDIDRAKNQREVVSAVGDKALSPWTFVNPFRYWDLSMSSAESFAVSEGTGPFALAKFALAMTKVDGKDGLTCGVPISDLAVNWDSERAPRLFQFIIEDDTASIPAQLCTPTGMPK